MSVTTQQTPTPSVAFFRQLALSLAGGDPDAVVSKAMAAVEEWHPHSDLLGAKRLLVEAAVEIALDEFGPNVVPHPMKLFEKFDLEMLAQQVYGPKRVGLPYERAKAYLRRIGVVVKENLSEAHVRQTHAIVSEHVVECFKS